MIVDFIRSCYTVDMILRRGDLPVRVRWYRAPDGAEVFPGPHLYSSTNWEEEGEGVADVGEVPGTQKWDSGVNRSKTTGHFLCGRLGAWRYGADKTDRNLVLDIWGRPKCCNLPPLVGPDPTFFTSLSTFETSAPVQPVSIRWLTDALYWEAGWQSKAEVDFTGGYKASLNAKGVLELAPLGFSSTSILWFSIAPVDWAPSGKDWGVGTGIRAELVMDASAIAFEPIAQVQGSVEWNPVSSFASDSGIWMSQAEVFFEPHSVFEVSESALHAGLDFDPTSIEWGFSDSPLTVAVVWSPTSFFFTPTEDL